MCFRRQLAQGVCGFVCIAAFSAAAMAEAFLVKDGRPQATILIAEKSPRTVKLAAEEFQSYIEKITGVPARLSAAQTRLKVRTLRLCSIFVNKKGFR